MEVEEEEGPIVERAGPNGERRHSYRDSIDKQMSDRATLTELLT